MRPASTLGPATQRNHRPGCFGLRLLPGVYDVTFTAPGFEAYAQKVAVPAPDDPNRRREEGSADDLLNLGPCRRCHGEVASFDYRGRQTEIYRLWTELGELLRKHNQGYLPGYKPGDKCAICHRGGTLPFLSDPHLVLENAYTNYKLIGNDRSWGVHNYRCTKKLLLDSLASVRQLP